MVRHAPVSFLRLARDSRMDLRIRSASPLVSERRAGVGGTRVDAGHPLLDETLNLRARTTAKVRGQYVIETLAGVFRRDPEAYDF